MKTIDATKKPGAVIRTGQKTPYVKASNYTVQERIELTADLLARGATTYTIKHALSAPPHNLKFSQITVYISRAREHILKQVSGRTRTQALESALAFYDSVIADEKQNMRDRLFARQRLDMIFGLDAPKNLHVSGPEGGVIEMALSTEMSTALETVYGKNAVIDVTAQIAAGNSRDETKAPAPVVAPPIKKLPLFGKASK